MSFNARPRRTIAGVCVGPVNIMSWIAFTASITTKLHE